MNSTTYTCYLTAAPLPPPSLQVDAIFQAAALAANAARIPLAKMAVEETRMGCVEDKVTKNHFASGARIVRAWGGSVRPRAAEVGGQHFCSVPALVCRSDAI